MHDLNTINRLNAEAFADGINIARRQGKTVVALYAGLYLVSYQTFDDPALAVEAQAKPVLASERYVLYAPTNSNPQPAVTRDQCEDYMVSRTVEELAALGASKVERHTPFHDAANALVAAA